MTSSCFDGRLDSDWGSGNISIADHNCSISASRSATFLRFSTPGRAFHSASSRLPLSRAACNSALEATAISPSLTAAGGSRHRGVPSLPMMEMRMGGFSWVSPRGTAGAPTHALFAGQSPSIPDNVMALLGQLRAWNCSLGTYDLQLRGY